MGVEPLPLEPALSKAQKRAAAGKPAKPRKMPKGIPHLPELRVNPSDLGTPSNRTAAVVNMRLNLVPWPVIVEELGFADTSSAQAAYVTGLANMHPQSNWETQRAEMALRAENQLQRSLAMANADFLNIRGEDGKVRQIPNEDRLRWHDQAKKDLELLVMITGAKAPARLEVTASTAELNQMVSTLLMAHGAQGELEADVFDMDNLPPEEDIIDGEIVE